MEASLEALTNMKRITQICSLVPYVLAWGLVFMDWQALDMFDLVLLVTLTAVGWVGNWTSSRWLCWGASGALLVVAFGCMFSLGPTFRMVASSQHGTGEGFAEGAKRMFFASRVFRPYLAVAIAGLFGMCHRTRTCVKQAGSLLRT